MRNKTIDPFWLTALEEDETPDAEEPEEAVTLDEMIAASRLLDPSGSAEDSVRALFVATIGLRSMSNNK